MDCDAEDECYITAFCRVCFRGFEQSVRIDIRRTKVAYFRGGTYVVESFKSTKMSGSIQPSQIK
jgi:hypothetical protein